MKKHRPAIAIAASLSLGRAAADAIPGNTELGINRVSVRSTMTPGTITVTASRSGLKPARVTLVTKPVKVTDGLASYLPQHLAGPAEK